MEMNSWDRYLLVVWHCTIGPVLFCLLLICGIASFFLGGPSFFRGCWKMAKYSMSVDGDSSNSNYPRRYDESWGTTNIISAFLWTILFGIWLRMLFMLLMAATHLLLFSDRLSEAMLELAECARNPYDIIGAEGAGGGVGAILTDYSDTNAGETNPTSDFGRTPTPNEPHPCYVDWNKDYVYIYDENGHQRSYIDLFDENIENAVMQGDRIVVTTERDMLVYQLDKYRSPHCISKNSRQRYY